jgi:hypothetical protein
METKDTKNTKKTAIIVILIVLLGIGAWVLLGGKKGAGNGGFLPGGGTTTPNGEILTKGEVCWLPLPDYPKMTKFMEQRDEKSGSVLAMYIIEGSDKAEEIKDFYKTNALAEGWELDSEMLMQEAWILAFSKGRDYSLQVSVGYSEGGTQLTIACSGPSTVEKENPYDSAQEVKPASSLGTALHNDSKAVFDSIFGGTKLTKASSDKWSESLSYIVKRQITEEDAWAIKDSLEGKGYETTSASAGADKYDYDFSKEILGTKYDEIRVLIYLTDTQKILVSTYK